MHKTLAFFQSSRFVLPCFILAIFVILLADNLTQLGFAHGMLYAPLILLAGFTYRYRLLNLTASLSIMAIWLGYFIAPPAPDNFSEAYVLANRGLATLVIAILWWLSFKIITHLQLQQTQLQQEKRARLELNLAQEVAGLSHWHLNDYRKMVVLDAASCELLKLNKLELTIEQFYACFDDASQTELTNRVQACLFEGKMIKLEMQLANQSLPVKRIKLVAYPDPDNRDIVRGLLQNLQPLLSPDDALSEQIQQFKYLADTLPVKVWIADADGLINFISQSFAVFCGWSAERIVADWLNIIHPEDQAATMLAWQQALQHETSYKIEFRLLGADGQYSWHLMHAVPIYQAPGQLSYWFGSAMDISKQKALWLQTDELKRSLYQILENVTDGLFMLDAHFHFSYINQQALEWIAGNRALSPGKHMTEVFYQSEVDFSPLISAIQRAFTEKQNSQLWFTLPSHTEPSLISIYPASHGVSVLIQLRSTLPKKAGPLSVAPTHH
ncbi:PAS domain-containing protein [Rheinheimera sp. UJ63]|uniref:PAS domain-containing protein n=1 Tax=Rheinheimera sp. UJ63 TaxID=2910157 RepID=UPI001F454DB7|nr:PAS domain S-box protein [Rheinheimera sp. UJ63]MCF4010068.1 PAS domain S-box protein [Rheinheimera sp. UJ63]